MPAPVPSLIPVADALIQRGVPAGADVPVAVCFHARMRRHDCVHCVIDRDQVSTFLHAHAIQEGCGPSDRHRDEG